MSDHQHHPTRGRVPGTSAEPPRPPEQVLDRHGARLLNPVRSPRQTDAPLSPTAYTADLLILPGGERGEKALQLARDVARERHLRLEPVRCCLRCETGASLDPDDDVAVAYRLAPDGRRAVAPDAWALLQDLRVTGDPAADGIGLDHLMFGPRVGGTAPHTSGHGTGDQDGLASYGRIGSGGRQVVSWVGNAPVRSSLESRRRPQVAVLDTGCGRHPWLEDGVRRLRVSGGDADDPEKFGDQDSPLLGELDSHSGHGTFVAGILRQGCPDADLLTIRVMGSDGVVREWETLHVLQSLLAQTRRWVDGDETATRVDVVVLSLGYYHETPVDPAYTLLLRDVLHGLGELGVVVVTAAGNDATTRPFYPAALGPEQDVVDGPARDRVPVLAVGSLNPDGRTIALFNNAGPWIRQWRPGVSLVSTVPTDIRGGLQARVRLEEPVDGEDVVRATIDDDDFRGGFAVWSGTSFAAPVLAAEVADRLIADGRLGVRGREEALERGWRAVEGVTRLSRGPRR